MNPSAPTRLARRAAPGYPISARTKGLATLTQRVDEPETRKTNDCPLAA
jgi:hypothetical protein